MLLSACGDAQPASKPAQIITIVPMVVINVILRVNADRYSGPEPEIGLLFVNNDDEPVYLPVCGPWEIIRENNPNRPVWDIACEIDYLGHRVDPGESFTGTLRVPLSPGAYQAVVLIYGRCWLGVPVQVSPTGTNYGEFAACSMQQQVHSTVFTVTEK